VAKIKENTGFNQVFFSPFFSTKKKVKICENFSFSSVNYSTNFTILLENFANFSNKKEKGEDKTLDKI
jgi:hypothetical protein